MNEPLENPPHLKTEIFPELANLRLDKIVSILLPETSIRKSRRLIATGQILLNKKKHSSSTRGKTGDLVEYYPQPIENTRANPIFLRQCGSFSFYFKPSGLHTVHVEGKANVSLENWLDNNFAHPPILLQRLDYQTCGIICAAYTTEAACRFRAWEKKGLVQKLYLCLLAGNFIQPLTAKAFLNTDNRKKTGISKKNSPLINQTTFIPLPELPVPDQQPATWAIAKIFAGKRHQIRAHAAGLGHPLINDTLYGTGSGLFMLRQFCIILPEATICSLDNFTGAFALPAAAKAIKNLVEAKLSTYACK